MYLLDMNKLQKRLMKIPRVNSSALVLGSAFGQLEQILDIFDSVFVVVSDLPTIKAKNLIYKEDFDRLTSISDIGIILIDLTHIAQLPQIQSVWQKNLAKVCVQGNDRIDKHLAKPLYDTGWYCTSLQGMFHVWEKYI